MDWAESRCVEVEKKVILCIFQAQEQEVGGAVTGGVEDRPELAVILRFQSSFQYYTVLA